MKAKRNLFRSLSLFGIPIRYGVPVAAGWMILISGLEAQGGELFYSGGGASGGKPRAGANGGTPTPAASNAARAQARQTLARNNRTAADMRAMQAAARKAAASNGGKLQAVTARNAIKLPALPKTPNGLTTGGLKVAAAAATDPTKWSGASLPTQTVKNGRTKVTIKQTQQQALLHWDTFNVGNKTTLNFDQTAGGKDVGQWIAFNKINDPSGNPTQILGNIKANGQVYVINPNGVIFGSTSQVNARGLTVSSLPINTNLIQRGLTASPAPRVRDGISSNFLPKGGTLSLSFRAQDPLTTGYPASFPTAPLVTIGGKAAAEAVVEFSTDADGNPLALPESRINSFHLDSDIVSKDGFTNLVINNEVGTIEVSEDTSIILPHKTQLSFTAGNIDIKGSIIAPGGTLNFKALNQSPYDVGLLAPDDPLPLPVEGRGGFVLGSNALLSTAGLVTDDRNPALPLGDISLHGGQINIAGFDIDLKKGGVVDVSGGYFLPSRGNGTYCNAGSISIKAGQDLTLPTVLGGNLSMGSTLRGFSGAKSGSLAIQAPAIQLGGISTNESVLVLQSFFFNRGGFASYDLTGLGLAGEGSEPAVRVLSDVRIQPSALSFRAKFGDSFGSGVSLDVVREAPGDRNPTSLRLAAPGVGDSGGLIRVGNIVIEEGAVIRTDAGASVSVTGNTVTVLGSLISPGGTITVGGGTNTGLIFGDLSAPRTTTYLGARSLLSAQGATVLRFDAFGRRLGDVLSGGNITVSGNLAAAPGSRIDVSGTVGFLDVNPVGIIPIPTTSSNNGAGLGFPAKPAALDVVRTRIESNGGSITLRGGQMMFSDATLVGRAGGRTALGGSLSVSSGRFYPIGATPLPTDVSLIVSQSGSVIGSVLPDGPDAIGAIVSGAGTDDVSGLGSFSIDSFTRGRFDSLSLGGVVRLDGPIEIRAHQTIELATGGILFADSAIQLTASHVVLGRPGPQPLPDEQKTSPFQLNEQPFYVAPVHGSGSLDITATVIESGDISLQGIGTSHLAAENGAVEGNGTFAIAGDLKITAGHIYPVTASDFNLIAYDHGENGVNRGSILIESSGSQRLPFSAAGNLSLHASVIQQNGVLRAPFGTITLGWDGTGDAPINLLTGNASPFPVTRELALGAVSVTSVSAIDPQTGKGMVLPYGVSPDGNTWIDPRGVDITASGPPEKNITLSTGSITTESGSSVDLRGGGDLYAYRWVNGLGGPIDVLSGDGSFAVIPGYDPAIAPESPFNTTDSEVNLITDSGPGYVNDTLKAGDRVYLEGSATLKAGYYTLLPARYALLPGAVLVTETSDGGDTSVRRPDKSELVSGYRFNAFGPQPRSGVLSSRFEVASQVVVRKRAEYRDFLANQFLSQKAVELNIDAPLLPRDSAGLLFKATSTMDLAGSVLSQSIAKGVDSSIDISSAGSILITSGDATSAAGSISLNVDVLNSFSAGSLLIGGQRVETTEGTVVDVRANDLTVDIQGKPLIATDIIFASQRDAFIGDGSVITASSKTGYVAPALSLSGNGVLLRASSDPAASVIRTGVTSSDSLLNLGGGVRISGGAIILDSSNAMSINPTADLAADFFSLGAGSIRIQLESSNRPAPQGGLVLQGGALGDFERADSLSLLSYSSIDFEGSGVFGDSSLASLSLNSGTIRRLDQGSGDLRIVAGELTLGNSTSAAVPNANNGSGGNIVFEAGVIRLGAGELKTSGFNSTRFEASDRLTFEGEGKFSAEGNIEIDTRLVTGASRANYRIAAAGDLAVADSSGSSTLTAADGLGAILKLEGATVNVDSSIHLPGGVISITAESGDLVVSGNLDVSGESVLIQDATRYVNAGQVRLESALGSINLIEGAVIDLAADSGGGDAGHLGISTPNGILTLDGELIGKGGKDGLNGSFDLDVGILPELGSLSSVLTEASFAESQSIRVRFGDVLVDGNTKASNFRLSADRGGISVSGTIDTSGDTGGSIRLIANGDIALSGGAVLDASGVIFSSSGKGGDIHLEAGSQVDGVAGNGTLYLLEGSIIDLGVEAFVEGDALTVGSSASKGQFTGTLHLRAPRTEDGSDLQVFALGSEIRGVSHIQVDGFRVYDLTSQGGNITASEQASVRADAESFLGEAGVTTTRYTSMVDRLLGGRIDLEPLLYLSAGVEIINLNGDLTLGSAEESVAGDWDLSKFRFGAKNAPGVLTLRASGDLNFKSALSDGFSPTLPSGDATRLWLARPKNYDPLLPANLQSWTYRLAAGSDASAVDFGRVLSTANLTSGGGTLNLGNPASNLASETGANATTSSAIAAGPNAASNNFQVIRTGSGDIEIHAAKDVRLLNQFATIYTAGTRVEDATLGGLFDLPTLNQIGIDASLGSPQQSYPATYTVAGGNVSILAGGNIERLSRDSSGNLVADSQLQLPNNWLHRRGYVDPATGTFGVNRWGESASTSWWVDFSNFFQGVGALGGGNVTLSAAGDISNVDAAIPTNARLTGYTDDTKTVRVSPSEAVVYEFGGGDLEVSAGGNLDAGVYYVERGKGIISAGGAIHTNATRSVIAAGTPSSYTELPTTLFVGKGGFDVTAGGDVLLGPVSNPFLLPGALNNSFWHKTYFGTYSTDAYVNVGSVGGSVTLRTASTQPGQSEGVADPLLQSWISNKQLLSTFSASASKPWLRLSENKTSPFETLVSLMPGTLRLSALGGDVNLAGSITLSPAPKGTLEIIASGAIQGLQANGSVTFQGQSTTTWGASTINLSDADPSAIPGMLTPFAYQTLVGDSAGAASVTNTELRFLEFIDRLFAESGVTNAVTSTKQALHAAGLLHRNDLDPVRLYASTGDISGLTLFSPKVTRVMAGRDIQDIALYVQNLRSGDASIVSSGRDIILSQANSPLRIAANSAGNVTNFDSGPQAGDVQISGPGTLQVLAGGNLDLGTGSGNSDGTGTGITSIGNARNPSLPFEGAHIVAGAGMGRTSSLAGSNLDFVKFIRRYVATPKGAKYLKEIAPGVDFASQNSEEQSRLAIEVFYLILRDAGRQFAKKGDYDSAFDAIKLLFGKEKRSGEMQTRSRDIRTANGGNIDLIIPGGGLSMADTTIGNPLSPPGIITSGGGAISIFARNDISIGIGRIFTLRGGNEILWSSKGDIAAGASSRTVKSAPPTRVIIDPQSAWVQTDLAGLATGGGIGVLASVAGVKPGNVDLIAPNGTVDAGDAGIRVTGNVTISATQVLNAGNISAGGTSTGTPAPVSIGANIGSITTASSSSAAVGATTTPQNETQNQPQEPPTVEEPLSIFTVEVLGYGGGAAEEENDEEESPPDGN